LYAEATQASAKELVTLEAAERMSIDVNFIDRNGSSPLFHAAWEGQLDVAKLLLEEKAYVNLRNLRGNTALHLAVQQANIPMVKLLIR